MSTPRHAPLLIVEDDLALQKQLKWSLDRFESVTADDVASAVLQFRHNKFAQPDKLVGFITKHARLFSIRPDQRLVCKQDWPEAKARVSGVEKLVKNLAVLAA